MITELPISIVIPAHNEAEIIRKTLTSIKMLNPGPNEVIVAVSKNTSDNTAQIVRSFGYRVVEGGLLSFGRNNGVKLAKNEDVLIMDADMSIPSTTILRDSYEYFKTNKIDVGTTYYELDLESTSLLEKFAIRQINLGKLKSIKKATGEGEMCGIVFTSKTVMKELNGFNEELTHFEDLDFISRVKEAKLRYRLMPFYFGMSGRRYRFLNKWIGLPFAAPSISFLFFIINNMWWLDKDAKDFKKQTALLFVGKHFYGSLGGEPQEPE